MVTLHAEAVLFDLDGTLVDSTASVVRSWLTWAGEFDVDPLLLVDGHGRRAEQIVADVVPAPRTAAALARIHELELADADTVTAMPGAADVLDAIPAGRWAVVTSSTRPLAEARLAAAGLPAPAAMVTADDVTIGKPHPEPFLAGAALLGREPSTCVVIEDAPSGIAAARAAGMAVLGIVSTHVGDRLAADALLPSLRDLAITGTGPLSIGVSAP